MLDLAELAVSSVHDLTKKRCQLAEELAMLDALIERVHQSRLTIEARTRPTTVPVG
jgi:hypothetical protein